MKKTTLASAILLILTVAAQAADVATFVQLPDRFVIGGHSKGKWLKSAQAGKTIKPGTQFRLFTLKGEKGKVTATKAAPEAEVCMDVWMAELNEGSEEDHDAIGVAAAWNPMPRAVKAGDTKQDTYVKA